jgi:methyltransferase (TIGR00027 family)
MALFRALETARGPDALFSDPFAPLVLGRRLRLLLPLARLPAGRRIIARVIDRRSPGARESGIARTRLIDDWLAQAVQAGSDQVVLLGAGFDARAHRLGFLRGLRVFELDRAAVIDAKASAARRFGGAPVDVRRVAIDLLRGDLGQALGPAGFVRDVPTCFVWEGVTNYLDAAAVDDVLGQIASSSAPGSRLIFTYVHAGLLDGSHDFPGGAEALRAVERAGEPWTFGFDPEELPIHLQRFGLRLISDLGSLEYRQRYRGPTDSGHGYGFYRAVLAELA